jgi:hypothetical protein
VLEGILPIVNEMNMLFHQPAHQHFKIYPIMREKFTQLLKMIVVESKFVGGDDKSELPDDELDWLTEENLREIPADFLKPTSLVTLPFNAHEAIQKLSVDDQACVREATQKLVKTLCEEIYKVFPFDKDNTYSALLLFDPLRDNCFDRGRYERMWNLVSLCTPRILKPREVEKTDFYYEYDSYSSRRPRLLRDLRDGDLLRDLPLSEKKKQTYVEKFWLHVAKEKHPFKTIRVGRDREECAPEYPLLSRVRFFFLFL